MNALFGGFVSDDTANIINNPWIRGWSGLIDIFTHGMWAFQSTELRNYYRPMMHVGFLVTNQLAGPAPWVFHLVNVMLHAGVAALVFALAWRLTSSRPAAVVAGLVFAVNPVHTEAVAWASGLPELLCALFSLLALCVYARDDSWRTRALCAVAVLAALLSKETGAAAPVLVVAYDVIVRRRKPPVASLGLVGASVLAYVALRLNALGGLLTTRASVPLTTSSWTLSAAFMLAKYVAKAVVPYPLGFFYVFDPVTHLDARVVAGIGAVLFLAAALWLSRRSPRVLFALLVFVVPLLPALYLPALVPGVFAERYLYLPSAGVAVLVGLAAARALSFGLSRRVVLAAVAVAVTVGTAVSFDRIGVWRNELTFWADIVEQWPNASIPRRVLATQFARSGRTEDAIRHFEAGFALDPEDQAIRFGLANAYNERGVNRASAGNLEGAAQAFAAASRFAPAEPVFQVNLERARARIASP